MKNFFGSKPVVTEETRNAQMSLDIYNRAYTESDLAMKHEARGDFDGALLSYRRSLQWIAADPQRLLGDERAMSETSLKLVQAIQTIEEHAKDRIHALQVIVDEDVRRLGAVPPASVGVRDESIRKPVFVEPSQLGESSFDTREARARAVRHNRDSSPPKKMSESLRPVARNRPSYEAGRTTVGRVSSEDGARNAKAAASNAAMLAWGPSKTAPTPPTMYSQRTESSSSLSGTTQAKSSSTRPPSSNDIHREAREKPRYQLTDEAPASNGLARRVAAPSQTTGSRNPSPLPSQSLASQRTQTGRGPSPVSRAPEKRTTQTKPIATRAAAQTQKPATVAAPASQVRQRATGPARTTPSVPSSRAPNPAVNTKAASTPQVAGVPVSIVTEQLEDLSTSPAAAQIGLEKMTRAEEALKNVKGVDATLAKNIINEIVDNGDEVFWEDIAGLDAAKNSLKETVVYPLLRPDLFSGLREPVTGMLLFGPPGTGKTMLARAVATQAKATFFSISASSLTSKYLGESEKLVRALFVLAKELSPSIIFVDEIDSLLSSRGEGEHESSRRLKTEFLIQWSNLAKAAAGSKNAMDARVLVLAATNLPWAIDDAARRRFVRRQYIPLPEDTTRFQHLNHLIRHQKHTLSQEDIAEVTKLTDGFSGSDLTALAKDAAMGPLRSLGDALLTTDFEKIRPMGVQDFRASLRTIRPSVNKAGLEEYVKWDAEFGSN